MTREQAQQRLDDLRRQDYRAQQCDNAYANSGRMERNHAEQARMRRIIDKE